MKKTVEKILYSKMLKLTCLFIVTLVFQVSQAWDEGNNEGEQLAAARQQSDEYFANAFGYTSNLWDSTYYQPSAPEYFSSIQSRKPIFRTNIHPFSKYFVTKSDEEDYNQAEGRLSGGLGANLINTGLFNNRFTPANTWRPFANLANRIPITVNPNFDNPFATFDACTSPSGDAGICAPGNICSLFGGRPSGSCILGKVCCINSITTCGGTITLNNTFWQSPSTAVSAPSTCALTVRMDSKLVEQLAKPICQIRLDFVAFTTPQPTAGTCTDTFQVGGTTSVVPTICGDNTGQHMYLDVPSSAVTPTDVQLMFNFAAGTATATRSWNIKIAMLPCGASYLAPTDCLQYFTAATGRVKSFNWQDVASTATRQLNNQNYNICFRTEKISSQRATQMCVTVCQVTSGGDAFAITTVANAEPAVPPLTAEQILLASSLSAVGTTFGAVPTASCQYDFLLIAGGRDTNGVAADRYCGGSLNPAPLGFPITAPLTAAVPGGGVATSTQVCTPERPFRMKFQTDGTEAAVSVVAITSPVVATPDINAGFPGNTGFCLDYQEL